MSDKDYPQGLGRHAGVYRVSYDPDWMRYDSWLGDPPMMRPVAETVHELMLKLLGIDPKEHEERVAKLVEEELLRQRRLDEPKEG